MIAFQKMLATKNYQEKFIMSLFLEGTNLMKNTFLYKYKRI